MTDEDLSDLKIGFQVKPMERAQRNFALADLIAGAPGWPQLAQLLREFKEHLFRERRSLPLMLSRVVQLSPPAGLASAADMAQRAQFLDELLSVMLEEHQFDYKPDVVAVILKDLRTLRHAPPPLIMKAVLAYLKENTHRFRVAELFASVAAVTELAGRPPSRAIMDLVAAQSLRGMRFASGDDIANAAAAFRLLSNRHTVDPEWTSSLASTAQRHLKSMHPDALCDLALLMAKQEFEPTALWIETLLSQVTTKRSQLQRAGSYPALLYAAAKLGAPLNSENLKALLDDLLKPTAAPKAPAASNAQRTPSAMDAAAAAAHAAETAAHNLLMSGGGGRKAAAAAAAAAEAAARASAAAAAAAAAAQRAGPGVAGPSALSQLNCGELGTLASVLSIYAFSPADAWLQKFARAVADRISEMSGRQAATFVGCFAEMEYTPEGEQSDLLDELLAVAEPALALLPAEQLLDLAGGLRELRHAPDEQWVGALMKALESAAKGALSTADLAALASTPASLRDEDDNDAPQQVKLAAAEALAAAVAVRAKELGGMSEKQIKQATASFAAVGVKGVKLPLATPPVPPPAAPAAAAAATAATAPAAAATVPARATAAPSAASATVPARSPAAPAAAQGARSGGGVSPQPRGGEGRYDVSPQAGRGAAGRPSGARGEPWDPMQPDPRNVAGGMPRERPAERQDSSQQRTRPRYNQADEAQSDQWFSGAAGGTAGGRDTYRRDAGGAGGTAGGRDTYRRDDGGAAGGMVDRRDTYRRDAGRSQAPQYNEEDATQWRSSSVSETAAGRYGKQDGGRQSAGGRTARTAGVATDRTAGRGSVFDPTAGGSDRDTRGRSSDWQPPGEVGQYGSGNGAAGSFGRSSSGWSAGSTDVAGPARGAGRPRQDAGGGAYGGAGGMVQGRRQSEEEAEEPPIDEGFIESLNDDLQSDAWREPSSRSAVTPTTRGDGRVPRRTASEPAGPPGDWSGGFFRGSEAAGGTSAGRSPGLRSGVPSTGDDEEFGAEFFGDDDGLDTWATGKTPTAASNPLDFSDWAPAKSRSVDKAAVGDAPGDDVWGDEPGVEFGMEVGGGAVGESFGEDDGGFGDEGAASSRAFARPSASSSSSSSVRRRPAAASGRGAGVDKRVVGGTARRTAPQ